MRTHFLTMALATVLALARTAGAQAQPAVAQVIGEITSIDAAARQLMLKTDKGEQVKVAISDATLIRRVPPGATDMTKATRIGFADLGAGDRVIANGQRPGDQTVDARSVIVMSKSDLVQKQQQERAEWQKRSMAGVVIAVDGKAMSLTFRSGADSITVEGLDKAEFRRYAADSVKFSDAQSGSLADIKTGDQIRVLGDKRADGASIHAERIVTGSFRQIAATINSVNAQAGELTVKDLDTKKTLVVRVNADTTMKKLPPAMAAALARQYQGGGRAAAPQAGQPAGGRAPAGGGDVGQALDRLAAMPIAELKAGNAIMVSSTLGSDPSRVTAVMLLAGVEPLLTASPNATRDIMGGWNLSGASGQ